jgi:hypothetical protein
MRARTQSTAQQPACRDYDVFLSHRGPDSKDFCAFLREGLQRAGIHAFVDEHDLKPGVAAWAVMQHALQHARLVLPVFSEGYADSPWCLDELVLMMKAPEKVLPVFFRVKPDLKDVKPR